MSSQERPGVRAARALLSLLEETSAEELRAAESILGPKDLVEALQLLRRFKENEQTAPLTLAQVRDRVRTELAALPLSNDDIGWLAGAPGARWSPVQDAAAKPGFDAILAAIDANSASPRLQAEAYISLLLQGAGRAGPNHLMRILSLLHELAVDALTGNIVFFPTLYSLAELRTRWAGAPLPHSRGESRRSLVTRLLSDAILLDHGNDDNLIRLLLEGLRSPTDSAAIALRDLKPKKANGT